MLRTFIKYGLVVLVCYGVYKAVQFYAMLQFGEHIISCDLAGKVCPLVRQGASSDQLVQSLNQTLVCVRSKQSVLEWAVFPIKENMSTPSVNTFDYGEAQSMCKQLNR
jgi:hypothetical protein